MEGIVYFSKYFDRGCVGKAINILSKLIPFFASDVELAKYTAEPIFRTIINSLIYGDFSANIQV